MTLHSQLQMDSPLRHHLVVLAFLLLLTDFDVCNGGLRLSPSEKAMVSIFEAWNGSNPNLSKVLNWSLQNDPCADWIGCACGYSDGSAGQDVTRILMHGNSNPSAQYFTNYNFTLEGEVPAAFENLTSLFHLDLGSNHLEGTLDVIANIPSNLQYLGLSNNRFTGGVPFNNSNMTLEYLDLGNNHLEGILDVIANIPSNLQYLDLSNNWFTGEVPFNNSTILTTLQYLDLSNNQLNGSIDFILGLQSNLETIYLGNNSFSGDIPIMINSSSLKIFDVSNNKLGEVNFFNLPSSLTHLDVSNNNLSGVLDFFMMDLMSLIHINFSHNHFNYMNTTIDSFQNFTTIDLSNNEFENYTFPFECLLQLTSFYMTNNLLKDDFPMQQFLEFAGIENLYLDYNQFTSLTLPNSNFSGFTLSTLSLVGNNISTVSYSESGPFAEAFIGSQNLLFLGGNPYCNNIDSNLKSSVCRFSKSSPLLPVTTKSPRLKIVFSTIGAVFFLVMVAFGLIIRKLYKKNLAYRDLEQELAKQDVKPKIYSYNELRVATCDFNLDNKLGEGGFGVVYKGIFPDNTTIAVKRLIKSRLVLSDFFNEIAIISCVRHRNLIKLKGCCLSGDQRILVYEYVENKNLAQALWDCPNENNLEMDWSSRLNIILGIARGLAYLHEEVQPPIIHRDIKAPNILLDKDLNPKIADFGLAFLFPDLDEGQSHYTGIITGTRGYMSPEYASFGHISTAIDVFSFGIIILEIISGRKNIDIGKPLEQQILLQWAWKVYRSNELWHLVDLKLGTEIGPDLEDIIRVIKIGLLCLQQMPANRPRMSTVIAMLSDGRQIETIGLEAENEWGSVESYHATTTTSRLCVVQEEEVEESSLLATSA